MCKGNLSHSFVLIMEFHSVEILQIMFRSCRICFVTQLMTGTEKLALHSVKLIADSE